MYQKNLYQVPVDIETQALLQALRDGRLFFQPAVVPASDTRAEVLTIIARISDYATDPALTEATWHALLADDTRLTRFRLRPKHCKTTERGQSLFGSFSATVPPVNRYRIAAIVRYMLECGFYSAFTEMQMCRTAELSPVETTRRGATCSLFGSFCTFKSLCSLLFPGEDYDLYRRNCGAYSYYEDECIIRNCMCHE